MILFCRTSPSDPAARQADTSQFLVDLTKPGITIRPVLSLTGEHHFNEVVLEDVLLPAGAIIGREGDGWKQMTSEPAYEHGGPERFQSSLTLLVELPQVLAPFAANRATIAIDRLDARLVALRRLSHSGAGMLQFGDDPALVEDPGALSKKKNPDIACS